MEYTYQYPHYAITCDSVIFNVEDLNDIKVLLVTRKNDPYKGCLALPGGFLDPSDMTTQECAYRELYEETSLCEGHLLFELSQAHTMSWALRDPRERVISVVFTSICENYAVNFPKAKDDAATVQWVSLSSLNPKELAFDHRNAIGFALRELFYKNKNVRDNFYLDADEELANHINKLCQKY